MWPIRPGAVRPPARLDDSVDTTHRHLQTRTIRLTRSSSWRNAGRTLTRFTAGPTRRYLHCYLTWNYNLITLLYAHSADVTSFLLAQGLRADIVMRLTPKSAGKTETDAGLIFLIPPSSSAAGNEIRQHGCVVGPPVTSVAQ